MHARYQSESDHFDCHLSCRYFLSDGMSAVWLSIKGENEDTVRLRVFVRASSLFPASFDTSFKAKSLLYINQDHMFDWIIPLKPGCQHDISHGISNFYDRHFEKVL